MKLKKIVKKLIQISKEKEIVPIYHPILEKDLFQGKVALISGGTGGIGLAIAKSLLESGCTVIIAGTNTNKLEEKKKELNSTNVSTLQLDYNDVPSFNEKISKVFNDYGKVDIFVSSAGVHTDNVDFWTMTPSEFDRVLNINLKGTFFACQTVAKYMKSNGIKGNILLISSSRGAEPAWSPYGISKWSINGLTKGLAQILLPYGIKVNAIAPGSTATNLIGINEGDSIYTTENKVERFIMPDEVANLSKLLLSDAGNMILGEVIHISGGRGIFDIR